MTNFFKRKGVNAPESDSQSDDESEYVLSKTKSLYGQPMSWTRVKEVTTAAGFRISVFDVETDLRQDKALKEIRKGAIRELGAMIFDPDNFKE